MRIDGTSICFQNVAYMLDLRQANTLEKLCIPILFNTKDDISKILEKFSPPDYAQEVLARLLETKADIIWLIEVPLGPWFEHIWNMLSYAWYTPITNSQNQTKNWIHSWSLVATKQESCKIIDIPGVTSFYVPAIGSGHICFEADEKVYIFSHMTRIPKNKIEWSLALLRRYPTFYSDEIEQKYPHLQPWRNKQSMLHRDTTFLEPSDFNSLIFQNDLSAILKFIQQNLEKHKDIFWFWDLNTPPRTLQEHFTSFGIQWTLVSQDSPTWCTQPPLWIISTRLFSLEECIDHIWYFWDKKINFHSKNFENWGSDHTAVFWEVIFQNELDTQ